MRALLCACVLLVGCSPGKDLAVKSLDLAVTAGPTLVTAYRLEQEVCLALDKPDREPCVAEVRARWAPIKESYAAALEAACKIVPEERSCKDGGSL